MGWSTRRRRAAGVPVPSVWFICVLLIQTKAESSRVASRNFGGTRQELFAWKRGLPPRAKTWPRLRLPKGVTRGGSWPSRHLRQLPRDEEVEPTSTEAELGATADVGELAYEEEGVGTAGNRLEDAAILQDTVEPETEQTLGESFEEDEGDYGDITQPDPSEFADQNTKVKAATGATGISNFSGAGKVQTATGAVTVEKQKAKKPEEPKITGPVTLAKDVEDMLQKGIDAHDPLPQLKNTTAYKVTPASEKGSQATEVEEENLEALQEMQEPVGEVSLDSSLATEKAIGEAREEELKAEAEEEAASARAKASSQVAVSSATAEQEPEAKDPLEGERAVLSATHTDRGLPPSLADSAGSGGGGSSDGSSLMTQGAIIGSTIKDMVTDRSSSIAGIVALVVAVVAGVGVACAGISIYRQLKSRKDGKPSPRMIEINSLSRKSPTYSRVGNQNHDSEGGSGGAWKDFEDWEKPQKSSSLSRATNVKQKKAWDWDADW